MAMHRPNIWTVGHSNTKDVTADQMDSEELDRPAKELPLEVLYQLSLKLQNTLRGNWASLAEILGYGRDRIDEFDHQSAAEHKPPGYLVLKDWTKQECGRSMYVLRESLRQCDRMDCVMFLQAEIKNLLSMKLHLKITDETVSTEINRPYFLTINTHRQATLKDSLENVLGGHLDDYEISARWSDKAHKFKGMHLSIRRKSRSNYCTSLSCYRECYYYHQHGNFNNLSRTDQSNANPEVPVLPNITMDEHQTEKKSYVSEECLYCGKFKTFSQNTSYTPSQNMNDVCKQSTQSGIHCHTCTCDLSEIKNIDKSHFDTHNQHSVCDVKKEARFLPADCACEDVKMNILTNENEVSSTTDMDCNTPEDYGTEDDTQKETQDIDYFAPEACCHQSSPNNSTPLKQYDEGGYEQTFLKVPYVEETQTSVFSVVRTEIVEKDAEKMIDLTPENPSTTMTRLVVGTASYERLNWDTKRNRNLSEGDISTQILTLTNGHEIRNLGTFIPQKTPIEHSSPTPMACETQTVTDFQTPKFRSTRKMSPEEHEMVTIVESYSLPPNKELPNEERPILPERTGGRNGHVQPKRTDTPPTLPPRNNRATPYPSSKSATIDSKFTHLNRTLHNYPGWSPRDTEKTVEERMRQYLVADGNYLLWYMESKRLLVLSVSHLRKLVHYAIYVTKENEQLLYFIFKGETFTDLRTLLNYYKFHGLKPQSLQGHFASSSDFIQQQNLRGSRQMARLSHVQLLYPIPQPSGTRGRLSV